MFLLKKNQKFVNLVNTFAEAQVFIENGTADSCTVVNDLNELSNALKTDSNYESDVNWKEVIVDVWDSVTEEFDNLASSLIAESSVKKDKLFSELNNILEKTRNGFVSILDQLRDSIAKNSTNSDCCNNSDCCHKKEE